MAAAARCGARCGLSFEGYTHPERLVSTNVGLRFRGARLCTRKFRHRSGALGGDRQGRPARPVARHLWRRCESARGRRQDRGSRTITAALLPDDGPYQLEAFAPFRVHERSAAKFRTGRVLLAGDAAHVCNPVRRARSDLRPARCRSSGRCPARGHSTGSGRRACSIATPTSAGAFSARSPGRPPPRTSGG